MSCSFELSFPALNVTKVEEPSWLGGRMTGFESITTGFINLLQPKELPLESGNAKEVVRISSKDGKPEIILDTTSSTLINLVKEYEIPIVVVASIPFLFLLLMGFCYCLLCLERCICFKKAKAKEKSLTTPVLLLFFSGTMLSAAVYTVTSSRSLDAAINELPEEVVKSLNYLTVYGNITKKILDHLLSTDFSTFTQYMTTTGMRADCILDQMTIGNGSGSLKKAMDAFDEKQNEAAALRKRLESCASSGGAGGNVLRALCEPEISAINNVLQTVKSRAGTTGSQIMKNVVQAAGLLMAVRQMTDVLVNSTSYITAVTDMISDYKKEINTYDGYRSIATTTWAQVMLLTSIGVFAFTVLLLFALGPKGGPCHPPVSDKCIKTLLGFFTCFAHCIALLGSLVFLVLFIVGTNLHLLCRPLEDLEAAKGYVGAYSKVAEDYLHSRLKSALGSSGTGSSLLIFDTAEIINVSQSLHMKEIVHGCKKRQTLFVILKLNTLNFPSRLAHLFETQMQAFTGGDSQGGNRPGAGRQGPQTRITSAELPWESEQFGQGGPLQWPPPGNQGEGFENRDGAQGRYPILQVNGNEYGDQNEFNDPLQRSQYGRSLNNERRSRRSPTPTACEGFTKLNACITNLLDHPRRGCPEEAYKSFELNLKSLQNITSGMVVICPNLQSRFANASMTRLSQGLLKYGEHLNDALEKDILPCDVVIYSLGGLVNKVCWRFIRTINTWNFALGLWCYLVIFTVCLSRTVRHMIGIKSKKDKEQDESEDDR